MLALQFVVYLFSNVANCLFNVFQFGWDIVHALPLVLDAFKWIWRKCFNFLFTGYVLNLKVIEILFAHLLRTIGSICFQWMTQIDDSSWKQVAFVAWRFLLVFGLALLICHKFIDFLRTFQIETLDHSLEGILILSYILWFCHHTRIENSSKSARLLLLWNFVWFVLFTFLFDFRGIVESIGVDYSIRWFFMFFGDGGVMVG